MADSCLSVDDGQEQASRMSALDLYEDLLINENKGDGNRTLTMQEVLSEKDSLEQQNRLLLQQLIETKQQAEEFAREKENLQRNFDNLLATAKVELARKNTLLSRYIGGSSGSSLTTTTSSSRTEKGRGQSLSKKKGLLALYKGRRLEDEEVSASVTQKTSPALLQHRGEKMVGVATRVIGSSFENTAPVDVQHLSFNQLNLKQETDSRSLNLNHEQGEGHPSNKYDENNSQRENVNNKNMLSEMLSASDPVTGQSSNARSQTSNDNTVIREEGEIASDDTSERDYHHLASKNTDDKIGNVSKTEIRHGSRRVTRSHRHSRTDKKRRHSSTERNIERLIVKCSDSMNITLKDKKLCGKDDATSSKSFARSYICVGRRSDFSAERDIKERERSRESKSCGSALRKSRSDEDEYKRKRNFERERSHRDRSQSRERRQKIEKSRDRESSDRKGFESRHRSGSKKSDLSLQKSKQKNRSDRSKDIIENEVGIIRNKQRNAKATKKDSESRESLVKAQKNSPQMLENRRDKRKLERNESPSSGTSKVDLAQPTRNRPSLTSVEIHGKAKPEEQMPTLENLGLSGHVILGTDARPIPIEDKPTRETPHKIDSGTVGEHMDDCLDENLDIELDYDENSLMHCDLMQPEIEDGTQKRTVFSKNTKEKTPTESTSAVLASTEAQCISSQVSRHEMCVNEFADVGQISGTETGKQANGLQEFSQTRCDTYANEEHSSVDKTMSTESASAVKADSHKIVYVETNNLSGSEIYQPGDESKLISSPEFQPRVRLVDIGKDPLRGVFIKRRISHDEGCNTISKKRKKIPENESNWERGKSPEKAVVTPTKEGVTTSEGAKGPSALLPHCASPKKNIEICDTTAMYSSSTSENKCTEGQETSSTRTPIKTEKIKNAAENSPAFNTRSQKNITVGGASQSQSPNQSLNSSEHFSRVSDSLVKVKTKLSFDEKVENIETDEAKPQQQQMEGSHVKPKKFKSALHGAANTHCAEGHVCSELQINDLKHKKKKLTVAAKEPVSMECHDVIKKDSGAELTIYPNLGKPEGTQLNSSDVPTTQTGISQSSLTGTPVMDVAMEVVVETSNKLIRKDALEQKGKKRKKSFGKLKIRMRAIKKGKPRKKEASLDDEQPELESLELDETACDLDNSIISNKSVSMPEPPPELNKWLASATKKTKKKDNEKKKLKVKRKRKVAIASTDGLADATMSHPKNFKTSQPTENFEMRISASSRASEGQVKKALTDGKLQMFLPSAFPELGGKSDLGNVIRSYKNAALQWLIHIAVGKVDGLRVRTGPNNEQPMDLSLKKRPDPTESSAITKEQHPSVVTNLFSNQTTNNKAEERMQIRDTCENKKRCTEPRNSSWDSLLQEHTEQQKKSKSENEVMSKPPEKRKRKPRRVQLERVEVPESEFRSKRGVFEESPLSLWMSSLEKCQERRKKRARWSSEVNECTDTNLDNENDDATVGATAKNTPAMPAKHEQSSDRENVSVTPSTYSTAKSNLFPQVLSKDSNKNAVSDLIPEMSSSSWQLSEESRSRFYSFAKVIEVLSPLKMSPPKLPQSRFGAPKEKNAKRKVLQSPCPF